MGSDDDRVRLSREVRIGELVAALVAISAMATGYIELRLRPLEQQLAAVEQAGRVQAEAAAEFKRELKADISRLDGKLDRLIEGLRTGGGR